MLTADSPRNTRLQNCPWLRTEPKRRQTRRAYGHDYKAPGVYMITMTAEGHRPPLSSISRSADGRPQVELTPLGALVGDAITGITRHIPSLEVRASVIMPDHIHLLIWVRERLERDLGQYLAGFKAACSKLLREARGLGPDEPLEPLFLPGFHDRLIRDSGQYDTCARYIADNPRRLLVRRERPDLFRRYNRLTICGHDYAAYGNIFLLRNFDKRCVMIHRADTAADKARQRAEWIWCAANGGVLVSPFISKEEKAVRDEALSVGGNIITLRHDGFPERFKPSAAEFGLCSEGRLLLLAPWPENSAQVQLSRSVSLRMNALAQRIAAMGYDEQMTLRR